MRRLLSTAAVAVALSIPAVATVGLAGPAFAKTDPVPTAGSSIVCTKVTYKAPAADITKCYTATGATAKAFKTLGAASAATLISGGTLTWSPGPAGGATVTTGTLTAATPTGTCSKKDSNLAYSGTVTGVTGTGNPAAAGDLVYVDVCVTSSAKVSLAKGSFAEF